MKPPRLPTLLLALLPAAVREVIAGDLEESWNAHPSRLRYWRMALGSLAAWGRHRVRGGYTSLKNEHDEDKANNRDGGEAPTTG